MTEESKGWTDFLAGAFAASEWARDSTPHFLRASCGLSPVGRRSDVLLHLMARLRGIGGCRFSLIRLLVVVLVLCLASVVCVVCSCGRKSRVVIAADWRHARVGAGVDGRGVAGQVRGLGDGLTAGVGSLVSKGFLKGFAPVSKTIQTWCRDSTIFEGA